MSAPAFSAPTWATSSPPASTVLPAQLRLDGYAAFDIPTADGLNRWRYEVGAYLDWLTTEAGAPFAEEHYVANTTDAYGGAIPDGSHEDIIADSVTIRGEGPGASQGGTLTFRDAGRASDNTAIIAVGAVLAETVILQFGRAGSAVNVQAELDGGVWRSTLQGGATWAMEVDNASDKTLYVRNTDAGGVANLDVEGAFTCNGVASFITSIEGVSGTLTCTDQFAAQGGLAAGFDSDNTAFRYLGASRQTFEQDISPYMGHFQAANGAGVDPLEFIDGTPPYVTPSGTNINLYRAPLALSINTDNVPNSTAYRLITGVQVRYYRTGASDRLTVEIVRVKRDGSAAENVLLTYSHSAEFTTTGAWTNWSSGAIAATSFDPTYYHFARLTIENGGAQTCRVANIILEWEARHIEAAPL